MKHLLFILGLAIFFSFPGLAATRSVLVVVDGFKETKGKLMIGIYDSDSTFMKTIYKGYSKEVLDTTLEFAFELPEGEYAISVYHDVNENNTLDVDSYGMPTESYGFSYNVQGQWGPPSFNDCKFLVAADSTVIRINLFH